jgi:hypothetical protein
MKKIILLVLASTFAFAANDRSEILLKYIKGAIAPTYDVGDDKIRIMIFHAPQVADLAKTIQVDVTRKTPNNWRALLTNPEYSRYDYIGTKNVRKFGVYRGNLAKEEIWYIKDGTFKDSIISYIDTMSDGSRSLELQSPSFWKTFSPEFSQWVKSKLK